VPRRRPARPARGCHQGDSRTETPLINPLRSRHRDARSHERPGAWMLGERLGAAVLPVHIEGAPLDLVPEVLARIHGDPMRLMDGKPLREQ